METNSAAAAVSTYSKYRYKRVHVRMNVSMYHKKFTLFKNQC